MDTSYEVVDWMGTSLTAASIPTLTHATYKILIGGYIVILSYNIGNINEENCYIVAGDSDSKAKVFSPKSGRLIVRCYDGSVLFFKSSNIAIFWGEDEQNEMIVIDSDLTQVIKKRNDGMMISEPLDRDPFEGPAMILSDGTIGYYSIGRLCKMDRPSLITSNGTEKWG